MHTKALICVCIADYAFCYLGCFRVTSSGCSMRTTSDTWISLLVSSLLELVTVIRKFIVQLYSKQKNCKEECKVSIVMLD